ncbi:expressed unknown protein [Seminavis robusta]|uniref:RING-type domain-containing protein n=1 Tax=Seminavis robusta TaxID=568900 RepID=A0A9N8E9F4_9STRA|nr:expressed unknown protein [Seminavis robusta]|eukprot:Sro654_g182150.1 n/a (722) ;mRNA; f:47676-49841
MEAQKDDDDDVYTTSCPICFAEEVSLAKSPTCGHAFCIDCLRQFFALPEEEEETTAITSQQDPQQDVDQEAEEEESASTLQFLLQNQNADNIATIGRCPLCRNPISLLTMVHRLTGRPVWTSGRVTRLEESPLAGKIFATRRGIGFNSFHFPPHDNHHNNNTEQQQPSRPFMLWKDDKALYTHHNNNNTKEEQTKYYLDQGCFYFIPKRTFHGTVSLPDSHGNPQQHDVLLCFAPNHSSINGGFMLRRASQPPTPKTSSSEQPLPLCCYQPLDGSWWVSWYREKPQSPVGTPEADRLIFNEDQIQIKDNVVYVPGGLQYLIRYETDQIYFHWPELGVLQTLDPKCDFRNADNNNTDDDNNTDENTDDDSHETKIPPPIGYELHWHTTSKQQPFICWKRETIESPPTGTAAAVVEYLGLSGGQQQRMIDPALSAMIGPWWYREVRPVAAVQTNKDGRPPYVAKQLWGNSFCQGKTVGLASYHFTATSQKEENGSHNNGQQQHHAYISYENEKCYQWPPLDDGSPIPAQVYFHNIAFEQVQQPTRTAPGSEDNSGTAESITHVVFRGTIEWLHDYGTTWQNHKRWEYEMQFDSQFTCIVSGTVHCITESDERREMSTFGTSLVYINAGIVGAFDMWMMNNGAASSSSDNHVNQNGAVENGADEESSTAPQQESDSYQRYKNLSRDLRVRLQEEGASVRTVAILNAVLTRSQQPGGESPIDYNV